jgi:TetR/AcrR family transcriptional repressor of nem operon
VQTRLRIIRAAADLFHQKGARATSPDEIIEASQTGKGQFYYYFGSKDGLVHAVLQAYLDAIKAGTSPVDYEVTSWDELERWFLSHLELQQRYKMTRGCPFGTLANEVTAKDELIREDLQLIEFCIATVQGAMLMGKLDRSSRTAEATVREALTHLKSYLLRSAR